jgi:tRNA-dihydrouridine synthase
MESYCHESHAQQQKNCLLKSKNCFLVNPFVSLLPLLQSELAFRMLCRHHGATAAYTPMLHARLFLENKAYRAEHFTTCEGDRPLFVQFCANEPHILLASAQLIQARGSRDARGYRLLSSGL